MSWKPEVEGLEARRRRAAELGGAAAVERQHALGRSTIREWVGSFAYGAGQLLLDALLRHLLALAPDTEMSAPPPHHFRRAKDPRKRRLLEKAYRFWLSAEALYAQVKTRQPRLHFRASDFFSFLLHWLQSQSLPPRLLWSPALPGTPTTPF